jgi:hypothetical protein
MSAGYEKKDVSVKAIVLGAAFTIILIVIFVIFLDSYFVINKEKYIYDNVTNVKSVELQEIKSAADSMLHNYSILDKDKGIYQIPIDSAMQMVVDDYTQK